MSCVTKFCSHWKYCNITHDIPDRAYKSVCLSNITQQTFACLNSTSRTKLEICSQLTTKALESRNNIVLVSSFLIFNIFHTLFLCLSFNFEHVVSYRDAWYRKQSLWKNIFPFNFVIIRNLFCDMFSRGWNKNGRYIVSTIP